MINVGAASKLVFTTRPGGGVTEGTAFATQPVVTVQDSYSNPVTTDTGNVTLGIATGPGAGSLSCTATTVAATAGVATFAGCTMTGTAAAGTYTLSATRSGLTTGNSSNLVITVGAANKLAFTTQPVAASRSARLSRRSRSSQYRTPTATPSRPTREPSRSRS